jgi:hypothetical protein
VAPVSWGFIVLGFHDSNGTRVFEFEYVSPDGARSPYTIRADLSLARRYGIQIQALPLLCRAVLEQRDQSSPRRLFEYSEEHMRLHAENVAATLAAAKPRKPHRRPPTNRNNTTGAWRQSPGGMPV